MRNQPFLVAGLISRGCRKHWTLTHHDGTKMHEMKIQSVGGRLTFTTSKVMAAVKHHSRKHSKKAGSSRGSQKAGKLSRKRSKKSVAFSGAGIKPVGSRGTKKIPKLGH